MLGLGRTWLIATSAVVGLGGAVAYFALRTPPGVVARSDDETVAWIGLATAVFGFLTAIVGLIEKLVERRMQRGE